MRKKESNLLEILAVIIFSLLLLMLFSTVVKDNKGLKILSKEYKYSLNTQIDPKSAEDFKQFLLGLGENDIAIIHIESFGGLGLSNDKIIYYMKESKAELRCYVDSHAMSAGANILMRCDKIRVTPNSKILFHVSQVCSKTGLFGCIEYKPVSPTFYPEYYKEAVEELSEFKYIFTKEEWKDLLDGEDIIIKGKEFMKRLPKERIYE